MDLGLTPSSWPSTRASSRPATSTSPSISREIRPRHLHRGGRAHQARKFRRPRRIHCAARRCRHLLGGAAGSGWVRAYQRAVARILVKAFRRLGFDAFDLIRRATWGDDRVAPWVQQNCILFIRDPQRVPASLEPYRICGTPSTIVHRSTYSRLRRKVAGLEKAQSEAAQQKSQADPNVLGDVSAIQPSPTAEPAAPAAPTVGGSRSALQQVHSHVVADMLEAAIVAGSPCSLIWLSHCEAKFLAWPHAMGRREIARSLKRNSATPTCPPTT